MARLMVGTVFGLVAFLVFLSVSSWAENDTVPDTVPQSLNVSVIGDDAQEVGSIALTQGTIGVLARVDLKDLPPGVHGFHIHAVGTCDHMDHFKSASGHVNPGNKKHGYLNPEGPEIGDLPNLIAHDDGRVLAELFLPQVDMKDLLDKDGSSFMIHVNEDDHNTQPIGGAGARIACGVIE